MKYTLKEQEFARIMIFTSGNELLTLINDILDLSKLKAGKLNIEAAQVNTLDLKQLLPLVRVWVKE